MRALSGISGLVLIVLLTVTSSCGGDSSGSTFRSNRATIHVYAAVSLSDVLSELADSFLLEHEAEILFNTASSGTLARQIEHGAPADIFISANTKWAHYIDSLGYYTGTGLQSLAGNELVFITPSASVSQVDSIHTLHDLRSILGSGRLSVGDPEHVPAGIYAKQALEYLGWYQEIGDRILPAKDVRAALMMVELGESPLGIVYRTDALRSEKVRVCGSVPPNAHEPIQYMGGLCSENETAREFFTYIASAKAAFIWDKHGFSKQE